MDDPFLISYLKEELNIDSTDKPSLEELKGKLVRYINDLIQNDFKKLIQILYRIDVPENKLRNLLKENPNEDTSILIADLIIERQIQKIRFRQNDGNKDKESTGDDW